MRYQSSQNRKTDIPYISHEDPLPAWSEPDGRWAEPYETGRGVWAVMTRHPLTYAAINHGLKSRLDASSLAELRQEMVAEDARWLAYMSGRTPRRDT